MKRKLLKSEDQARAVGIMMRFRSLHMGIEGLDEHIAQMQARKDALLTELESTRADDTMLHADLESLYGPGRLDAQTLEWVYD